LTFHDFKLLISQYPVEMHSWEPGTFFATDFAPACPQPGAEQVPGKAATAFPVDDWVHESRKRRQNDLEKILGQEDNCLTIDIYTPTVSLRAWEERN
jgi:hypothetical protein